MLQHDLAGGRAVERSAMEGPRPVVPLGSGTHHPEQFNVAAA